MDKTSSRWWLTTDSSTAVITSSPEHIYELVSDLPRMGEWSPECQKVEWDSGVSGAAVDATFVGHNVSGPGGLIKWSRRGRVLVADIGREFSFRTEEGGRPSTVWTYRLEACDGATKVTESYRVEWIPLWARIMDVPTNRARELTKSMATTLASLKAAAEKATTD